MFTGTSLSNILNVRGKTYRCCWVLSINLSLIKNRTLVVFFLRNKTLVLELICWAFIKNKKFTICFEIKQNNYQNNNNIHIFIHYSSKILYLYEWKLSCVDVCLFSTSNMFINFKIN